MSRRAGSLVLSGVLVAVMAGCGPEGAVGTSSRSITNGMADNGEHPYVGLMVAKDSSGAPLWRCSGTLISPTLYLTAGHCTEAPAVSATIWFEEDVQAGIPGNGYPNGGSTSVNGTVHVHPQYMPHAFYMHDLGVVVLDQPVAMAEYGELPTLGVLDAAATKRGLQKTTLTAVGYGLQRINPVFVVGYRARLKAELRIIDLRGTFGMPDGTAVIVSNNANTGGTCFGDSGGPEFLNGSRVVAAVTSFGMNGNCAGTGGGYRVDTADDLNWLQSEFGDQL